MTRAIPRDIATEFRQEMFVLFSLDIVYQNSVRHAVIHYAIFVIVFSLNVTFYLSLTA